LRAKRGNLIQIKKKVKFIGLSGVHSESDLSYSRQRSGIDSHFPLAFLKAAEGAGFHLPHEGRIFVSVPDEDKPKIIPIVEKLERLGFSLVPKVLDLSP